MEIGDLERESGELAKEAKRLRAIGETLRDAFVNEIQDVGINVKLGEECLMNGIDTPEKLQALFLDHKRMSANEKESEDRCGRNGDR